MFLEHLGGRKFLICLLSLFINSILVWMAKIDPGVYSAVTIAVIGGYITGNVVQKNVSNKTKE
jgi:hypothetical protein